MKEKIKTILWFLNRPSLYPQMAYLIRLRLSPHPKENTREESEKWCSTQAVLAREAYDLLFQNTNFESFKEIHSELYNKAIEIESTLPVNMGFGGDIDLLFNISRQICVERVVETGVARGWSSLSILSVLPDNGQLISTDMPYPKMNNEDFVGCVIPDNFKSKWQLIRKPDRQGLPLALRKIGSIDLCHYDSDKTYVGRKWAYPLLWKYLRKGGLFISDDIGDNIAFKEFCEELNTKPIVVEFGGKYIGISQKP